MARIFTELGAEIVDADQLARAAVEPNSPGLAKIIERFGEKILTADGELDRKAMGDLVFGDTAARKALNEIVHPEVQRLSAEAFQAHIAAGVPIVLYDVPLLYESGLEAMFSEIIVVHVPREVQRERIRSRDGFSDEEIDARIAAQGDLDEKAERANYIIDNRGPREETRRQVEALWSELNQ